MHSRGPRNCGDECTNNWNKPGEHDRLVSIRFVEIVRPFQMNAKLFVAMHQGLACPPSDEVAGLISNDCGNACRDYQPADIQQAGRCEYAGGHKE